MDQASQCELASHNETWRGPSLKERSNRSLAAHPFAEAKLQSWLCTDSSVAFLNTLPPTPWHMHLPVTKQLHVDFYVARTSQFRGIANRRKWTSDQAWTQDLCSIAKVQPHELWNHSRFFISHHLYVPTDWTVLSSSSITGLFSPVVLQQSS